MSGSRGSRIGVDAWSASGPSAALRAGRLHRDARTRPPRRTELSTAPMPPGLTTMADQTPAVVELVRHREWGAADARRRCGSTARGRACATRTSDPASDRALHRLERRHRPARRPAARVRAALELQQRRTLDLELRLPPGSPRSTSNGSGCEASRLELDAAAEGNLAAVHVRRRRPLPPAATGSSESRPCGPAGRGPTRRSSVLREAVADGDLGRSPRGQRTADRRLVVEMQNGRTRRCARPCLAPPVGLEPTTLRLTAECSAS